MDPVSVYLCIYILGVCVGKWSSTEVSEQAENESSSDINHVVSTVKIKSDKILPNKILPIPSTYNQSISTTDIESIETSDTELDSGLEI